MQVKSGMCGVCPSGCWVKVHLDDDGRMVKVEPDDHAPPGMFCKLGEHSPEIVYAENRLKTPLRRVGPKGSYDFEPVTWDEAYQTIVEHLQETRQRFGPEAVCIYTGRGSFELSLCDIFQPREAPISSASSLLFPFGSPNTTGVGALCYVSFAIIAPHVTLGEILVDMYSDYDNAEMIVVWGGNPATDSPPMDFHQILQASQRGAEVVVIDPRYSDTARATNVQWIPIRPGTDGALALSMIQVLLEEDLHDEDFARTWTLGFDDLTRYVQHFRPEVVQNITGVSADTIRRIARRIAAARGVSLAMYSGLEYSDSGVQSIRAVLTLWALAGQLDVPGGRNIRMKENSFPINRSGLLSNPNVGRAIGRDQFPLYSHYRAESHAIAIPDSVLEGKPYRIRDMIILGGSIITAWPNPTRWRKTFEHLDMLVCIDRQLTADAAYADIVLPATTMYEIDSYNTYGPIFRLREKIIEPVGQARNDYRILTDLASRLGYPDAYPRDEEAMIRHALQGSGYTLEQVRQAGGQVQIPTLMMQFRKWEKGLLRPDGKPGFNTPTGKFEIASTILEEHGYDPLPVYTEPGEGPLRQPDLAGQFPLVFNSGSRVFTDFRSQHHGVPGLSRLAPEPTVDLHPKDAGARGIQDGDHVEVMSPRGRVRFKARVTEDIMPGSIDASMGGGGPIGPKAWQESNVNQLTDDTRYDPVSGFPVYKSLLCEVVKVDSGTGSATADPEATSHYQKMIQQVRQTAERGPTRRIYLDHNATTPVAPQVREAMLPLLGEQWGNPSSIHLFGDEARRLADDARRQIARLLGTTPRRIVITGGGSEADNLAIKGVAWAHRNRGQHIITSAVEHPAVLQSCRFLERLGWEVTYLPVDARGRVEPEDLSRTMRQDTVLVSIMLANNEVGTIQPIQQLAAIAHEHNALFHTDAVQAAGKIPIDVQTLDVDLATISAHKLHGPKGIGALYVRQGVELEPLVHGGRQEHGLRAGTENMPGIVGFGQACALAMERLPEVPRLRALRARLEQALQRLIPGVKVHGHPTQRLANTLNITLPGYRGESLVFFLARRGIALSSGSACKAGQPEPSHALFAMGLTAEEAHCALRFSLGPTNTEEEIDQTVDALAQIIQNASTSVRFVPCR